MQKIAILLAITLAFTAAEHHHHSHQAQYRTKVNALDYATPYKVYDLSLTADEAVKFVSGLLSGILQEDCSAIENCVTLSSGAVADILEAINQFSEHTVQGVINGVKILLKVLGDLPQQLQECVGAA